MTIKSYLPKSIAAIAIWPFIFVNENKSISDRVIRHEKIHHSQQKELLLIIFYLWYLVEYAIRLIIYKSHDKAYHNISFEREAFLNQSNESYLKYRRHYSFINYI